MSKNNKAIVDEYGYKVVGFYFPNQGSNLCSLQWKHRVLTTGS